MEEALVFLNIKPNTTHQRWVKGAGKELGCPPEMGVGCCPHPPPPLSDHLLEEPFLLEEADTSSEPSAGGLQCVQWELFAAIHSVIHSNIYWVPTICRAACPLIWELQPYLQAVHIRRGIHTKAWREKQHSFGVQRREPLLSLLTL